MSVFAVPRTWPLTPPASAEAGARWMPRVVDGHLQWRLSRNCALTPSQMGAAFAALCGVSLLIGLAFAWMGAPFVALFAGVEVLALAVALWACARHAGDGERLTLSGERLLVEQHLGARTTRTELPLAWLTIEPALAQGSLIELGGQGRRVRVGRFLRPEQRPLLAAELRRALRRAQAGLGPEQDLN
jgi:uncharacterized membrane protein